MFPYEVKPIEGELGQELLDRFHGEKAGFVEVGTKKWVLPHEYSLHAENYYNFELRPDDVWVMTYPRSGTTWMQEIVWLINNNLDYETATKKSLLDRFPFFEFNIMFGEEFMRGIAELNEFKPKAIQRIEFLRTPGYKHLENMTSPRHIKTHLPPSLCPPKLVDTCKVIYVARNPLDVAASYYHHNKLLLTHDFRGDFHDYWDLFERDLLLYSPYWDHIKEGWELRDHPNVLFIFYEDLLTDLTGNLNKIANFLNKSITADQINKLANFVHIDNFRKHFAFSSSNNYILEGISDPKAQGFIRRGKVGGNEEYEDSTRKRAENWFKKNLEKTDIKFPVFKL